MSEAAGGPTARQLQAWGLDPAWSRFVGVATPAGGVVRWHVLDNGAEPVHGTLVCTHGNPTWSYIWRDLLAQAPDGWRVVAVDQTGMGYSDRGAPRVLAERIDELVAFCRAHTGGPIAMAAHDWGGPVTVGAAARLDCRALVLTNTAVALPDGVKVPPLIAAARSAVRVVCEQTPVFVEGTAQMTGREHRAALRAPYRTRARRHAVAEFVADIPVGPDDASWTALEGVAAAFGALTCPVLLAWGGRDPVFHERFLADLQRRAPRAEVQVFPAAAHLVTLDAPVAEVAWEWLIGLDGAGVEPSVEQAAGPTPDVDRAGFRPITATLAERADDPAPAFSGPGGARSWQMLAAHARAVADRLLADGLAPGDRVALLVPPSADCLAAAYGIWMAGGVVVAVDSQLGLRSMRRLLRGATVQFTIGTARTIRLARALGLTPGAHALVVPAAPVPATGARPGSIRPPTELPEVSSHDPAAVVHTSGATGPAKPVAYSHAALAAQRDAILGQFPIGAFTTSFAPFMLVGPSLGLACSLPDDVTPGALDFDAFAAASRHTTTAWLSPAAAERIVDTAAGRVAPMELVMLAGAPVRAALAEAVAAVTGADVRAPYGMTEALPLTDGTTPAEAGAQGGTCTGHPLDGVRVVIDELPGAPWGEVLVSAPWMRSGYDRRWAIDRDTTVVIDGRLFHRTGDVGYLDDRGRLFQLGRRVHVITTAVGPLACVVPEQQVLIATGRTAAAVGVGPEDAQVVVVVVDADTRLGLADLATTAAVRAATAMPVAAVLTGRLPVDVRHRTKVDRVLLAADATSLLAGR